MTFLEYISIYVEKKVSLVIPSNVMRFGKEEESNTTFSFYHLHRIIHFRSVVCVPEKKHTTQTTTLYRIITSIIQPVNQSNEHTNLNQSNQNKSSIKQSISYVPSPTHNIIQGSAIQFNELTFPDLITIIYII